MAQHSKARMRSVREHYVRWGYTVNRSGGTSVDCRTRILVDCFICPQLRYSPSRRVSCDQAACWAAPRSVLNMFSMLEWSTSGVGMSSKEMITNFIDGNREGSFAHSCRQRRHEEFMRRFPDLASLRVLDLGGTADAWRTSTLRPLGVTLVNIAPQVRIEPWMNFVRADACSGGFGQYDVVFSNSLMEHLGGHARRQQFADVVQQSAPSWWIQTPYRYFPVEPHWFFPCFQFLPFKMRLEICRRWDIGHIGAHPNIRDAAEAVSSTELISATEMRAYFPTSEIWFERLAGLPKSLVAIKAFLHGA